MSRAQILKAVSEERQRQASKGYITRKDIEWTPLDWYSMLSDYNAWARRMLVMGSPDKARKRFIQIAALAVAAVEAIDLTEALERDYWEAGPGER